VSKLIKYDKQDQQGKATFNKRNPKTTQQQEPAARSPRAGHKTKIGQGEHVLNPLNSNLTEEKYRDSYCKILKL
jgi:hypothetical protein